MSDIKINLVQNENGDLSLAQREEQVLEQAVERGEAAPEVVRTQSDTVKVDLRNFGQPAEPEVIVVNEDTPAVVEIVDEPLIPVNAGDTPKEEEEVIQVIGEQPEKPVVVEQPVVTQEEIDKVIVPENLKEVIRFMEDTGGTLEDYVRLNRDYSAVDNETLLKEYYKKTKPDLDDEEIDFLIEDEFAWDEDYEDEKLVRKKKLALKEELAKAQKYLSGLKDEYYKEVKLSSKLSPEEREAIEFYNKYNEEQATTLASQKEKAEFFQSETKKLFTDFKGFDFNVGDKKYRYTVKNPESIMEFQSDISNLIKEHLDESGKLKDAGAWHKTLYMGKNGDAVVQHFYEQGKADAIREMTMRTKNIDMDPRQIHQDKPQSENGFQVRALDVEPSSKLKIKFGKK